MAWRTRDGKTSESSGGRGTEPRRGIVINSSTVREAEHIAQRADFERRYGAPGSRKSPADILFPAEDD